MKTFRLVRSQFLPVKIDRVFEFFADAGNLEQLTPPWLRFQILTPQPIEVEEGTVIDYRLRLRGVPVRWQSEITDWEPPYRFVDVQRKGPYRLWAHEHRFEAAGEGTLVTDDIEYAVPGGDIVNRWLVGPDLERIFAYRAQWLTEWAYGLIGDGKGARFSELLAGART